MKQDDTKNKDETKEEKEDDTNMKEHDTKEKVKGECYGRMILFSFYSNALTMHLPHFLFITLRNEMNEHSVRSVRDELQKWKMMERGECYGVCVFLFN